VLGLWVVHVGRAGEVEAGLVSVPADGERVYVCTVLRGWVTAGFGGAFIRV
jgi:hypothetical protein